MPKLTKSEQRLQELEKKVKAQGVQLAYERLQFAGLVLKSGLCWFKGRYYLFVDRRKTVSQRRELLEGALEELDLLAVQGRLGAPPETEPQAQEPGVAPPEPEAEEPGAEAEPEPEAGESQAQEPKAAEPEPPAEDPPANPGAAG